MKYQLSAAFGNFWKVGGPLYIFVAGTILFVNFPTFFCPFMFKNVKALDSSVLHMKKYIFLTSLLNSYVNHVGIDPNVKHQSCEKKKIQI